MKRLANLMLGTFVAVTLFPIIAMAAQTTTKKPLPQVPVTYPGDNDETIIRRAKWIEGAKKEGMLVRWSSDRPEEAAKLGAEFNKIYPFIKLIYWRGAEEERTTRIDAEHYINKVSFDLSDIGDVASNILRWRSVGLVERFTDIAPGLKKRDKRMYSSYGDWAPVGFNPKVPAYNTKKLLASEIPRNWEDLLDPKWKGQIGLTTNTNTWYMLALGEGGWGIEKTESFLRKLKQQEIIWTKGRTAGQSLLIAGEFKIMGDTNLRSSEYSKKMGAPIEWLRFSPVPVSAGGTFILAKKAPHPNAARLYIEWLFSPRGLSLYEEVTGVGDTTPGSGSWMAKALEGLHLLYRTEEMAMKVSELGLINRFANILEITPE